MLNLFPIQFLALAAYALLRIVIGLVFLYLAHKHSKNFTFYAPQIQWPGIQNGRVVLTLIIISEVIIGGMFLVGFYTQIAAILSMGLCIKLLIWNQRFPIGSIPSRLTYLLLLTISLSLFVTGAGVLAFDLPI
jgi:uncharacterized membrane protein YphA (DoxX/SURF4 family)